jgi:hypothetical protein
VRLVDTNRRNVLQARLEGLDAVAGNILAETVEDDLDLGGMGVLLALTGNDEANALACQHFVDEFGSAGVYQLLPDLAPRSSDAPNQPRLGRLLFAPEATFSELCTRLAAGAVVKTTPLTDKYTWADFQRDQGECTLPLLAVSQGKVSIATLDRPFKPPAGSQLVTLAAS